MGQQLLDRLAATRRTLRLLVWVHGVGLVLAAAAALVAAVCLIDWLFHVSSGMRLLFLATVAAASAAALARWLVRPLAVPVRDLDVALRVERQHPELGEVLSSGLGFLKVAANDPMAGSATLRNRVIARAEQAAGKVAFGSILDGRSARRAVGVALGVALVCGGGFSLAPDDATIALRRLADPFGGPAWPQRTRLRVLNPVDHVAIGDPFAVEVEIDGVVPDRVTFEYRALADGETSTNRRANGEDMRPVRDGVFRGGIEATAKSFEFSVVGGDGRTAWMPVQAVSVPEETSLVLSAKYPAYTGLPPETYPEGRGTVKAVIGTRVELVAKSNKALASAELRWDVAPPIVAKLDDAGETLSASFTVEKDEQYRLLMVDRENLSNADRPARRYRVQAVPDLPPEVNLEAPATDLEVTASAVVPIKATVRDDFGLAAVDLVFTVAPPVKSGEVPAPLPEQRVRLMTAKTLIKQQTIEHVWGLVPLAAPVGSIITYHLEAADRRDSPAPNVGKGREMHLRIVTKEDVLMAFEAQQQKLREQLQQVVRNQQSAIRNTADAQRQAETVPQVKPEDRETIAAAELAQRRVGDQIGAQRDQGLRRQADEMLATLKNNQIADTQGERRVNLIQAELGRLAEQQLPPIGQSLAEARREAAALENGKPSPAGKANPTTPGKASPSKSAAGEPGKSGEPNKGEPSKSGEANKGEPQKAGTPSAAKKGEATPPKPNGEAANPKLAGDLASARDQQQRTMATMEQMLSQLDEWGTVAQVANDLRELQKRQGEATQTAREAMAKTKGKPDNEIAPDDKAALAKAAERQAAVEQQLGGVQKRMADLADKSRKDDPVAADMMKQAGEQTRKQNVGGNMKAAGEAVRQNQSNNAEAAQDAVAKSLKEIMDTMDSRREQELQRQIGLLKKAEKEAAEIAKEQRLIRRKAKEAQAEKDPAKRKEQLAQLAKRQQELEKRTEQLTRQLSKLSAENAGRTSGQAGRQMAQAGDAMNGDNPEQADREQERAEEKLEEVEREIAEARKQREDQLAQEQFAKIADSLRQLHERQLRVRQDIGRIEAKRPAGGVLPRSQVMSLPGLGRNQRGLADETRGLTQKLSGAKVVAMVLDQVAGSMDDAAARLGDKKLDGETVASVDRAARKIGQLLDSLKPDQGGGDDGKQKKPPEEGGGGGGGGGGGQGGDGIPDIAQLKLLKNLQMEINDSTLALAKARDGAKPTATQEKEFTRLSELQGKLADLVRELTKPKPPAEEKEAKADE